MTPESAHHPSNQLDRVICQIRFPALLEIDRRIDAFQTSIRRQYPNYSRFPVPALALSDAPVSEDHIFQSGDGQWSVTLSVNSISLTCSRYIDWAGFRSRFDDIYSSFTGLFDIGNPVRIGLRYINAVRPSSIGITDLGSILRHPYSDLMRTDLGTTRSTSSMIEYDIRGNISGRSVIGMIRFTDGESGILIDDDTFMEHDMEGLPVLEALDELNALSLETFMKISSDELLSKVIRCRLPHPNGPHVPDTHSKARLDTLPATTTARTHRPSCSTPWQM